jgi:polyisoprenoid-binding protein YceI
MESDQATTARFVIDSRMSRFLVRATAGGMLSMFGHNPTIAIRDFAGDAHFSADGADNTSLQVRIKALSLEVTGNVSDRDRREIERTMKEEVLETAKYPEITFESSGASVVKTSEGQYKVDIAGSLGLHGVTRPQAVPASVAINGDTLRAYGEFSLRQTDYNIKLASVAGGTLKLKDELNFTFDIVAHRKS